MCNCYYFEEGKKDQNSDRHHFEARGMARALKTRIFNVLSHE